MALSHGILASGLFLLLFITLVSAQQGGCSVDNSKPSVYENNPPGYVVATVHVERGFTIRIDLNSPDASFFTLQGSELQLSQSVDYEKDSLLLVYLICQNAAGQSENLEIFVTILNVNDNSPVFKQTNFTEVVPEDTKVNATIVTREDLSATDADLDTIFYELTTTVPMLPKLSSSELRRTTLPASRGRAAFDPFCARMGDGSAGTNPKPQVIGNPVTDGYFAIKGVNNPEIYLQKPLDYEKFKWTTLILYARDRPVGSNDATNTATATINIIIEQADTKPPWFLPCTFINADNSICISSPYTGRVNMSEMSTEPLILQPGPVYAIDPDYTINEKIMYSIVGGNADQVFSVDADTGNITMNKEATSPDSYLLQVMATQVNNIQKYSIAIVEIKVINKSHYAPYFEHRIYNGTAFVGQAPRSLVFQAGDSSRPLMITAVDDDFLDKVNPNIEYYLKNSTDFIATRDGLILTNVILQSPGTVTIEAVGKDVVSLQEASTVIMVEVVLAAAVTPPDQTHTAQVMGILGGTLGTLLLLALIFLGVMIYKQYGKPVKYLMRKKDSKKISGGHQNLSYKPDEHPDVGIKQHETSESSSVQPVSQVLEQTALPLPASNAEEVESLPKSSIASTITFGQEEKEEEMEEETENEKEVKSILKTDRRVADDGYKAVWFKTDVDPEAGENVEVIEVDVADGDDDSDQDMQKNEEEEEEEDYDKDDHQRGLGVSFASETSSLPAAEAMVNMSLTDTVADDDSRM